MEANFTDNNSKPSEQHRSTENLSRGRLYENLSELHCSQLGYELLARNFRIGRLEADIIARDGESLVLVEVRGRSKATFRPSRMLSAAKSNRLRALANMLQRKWKLPVRVELFEVWPDTENGTGNGSTIRRFVLHGPCSARD
jgi:putative endonuclease